MSKLSMIGQMKKEAERDFNKFVKDYKRLEEENRKLESDLNLVIDERDNAFKKIEQLREDLAYERTMLDNVKAEYENLQEINEKLKEELEKDNREVQVDVDKELLKANDYLIKENKKLKNAIEYRKKKSDKNQEKADFIDKIMKLPGVMVDGKIDWSKVAVYYMM